MPPKNGVRSSEPQKRWVPVSATTESKASETVSEPKAVAKRKQPKRRAKPKEETQEIVAVPAEVPARRRHGSKANLPAKQPAMPTKTNSASQTSASCNQQLEALGRGSGEAGTHKMTSANPAERQQSEESVQGAAGEESTSEGMAGSDVEPAVIKTLSQNGPASHPKAGISAGTAPDVGGVCVGLFESFYAERIDVQDLVALMRRFSHENDSNLRRIHQKAVALLLEDFQSLPHWPEKELLRTGELLGQLIRWNLIPDRGPLQRALCCMLHALREPANSLLHRFGHRMLEQFRSRLGDTEVGLTLSRHIVQPSLRLEEPDRKEVRRSVQEVPASPKIGSAPWCVPNRNLEQQFRMPVAPVQVSQTLLGSVPSATPLRLQGIQAGVAWTFGGAKAPPRAKQGTAASTEEKRDREARGKQSKRSSAKKKNAANQEQRSSRQGKSWPAFIEVELDTLKFCLTDDDVQVASREQPVQLDAAASSNETSKSDTRLQSGSCGEQVPESA